jgi:hypothetical protein
MTNPTPLSYSLKDSNGNTIYSGSNASYAINYCCQQENTVLSLSDGYYSDNGCPMVITLNSGAYVYGDIGAKLVIGTLASNAISAPAKIGGFTWVGS